MRACRLCIDRCFRQRQVCIARVSVQDKRSPAWPGRGKDDMYRCYIRSVQQAQGVERCRVRRMLHVKGANG